MDVTEALVDAADHDELLREVDRLCERRDWDGLVRLRDLCRAALERGRQVWPIASHAEHRLALQAPPRWAAGTLVPGAGQLGLGPLSEVAASTHTSEAMAAHAPPTPVAALAAHERVLRGEEVDPASVAVPVLELPLRLAAWEPSYPVAAYTAHGLEAPRPALPALVPVPGSAAPGPPADAVPDDDAARALAETVSAWTAGSNGRAAAVAVTGDAVDAVAALGAPPGLVRMGRLTPGEALALLCWAGASGGAHGRRRGAARGRFDAWWAAAALCGLDDPWPPDPDELGSAVAELRWHWWDAGEPELGWTLRLAVEDPLDGLAWAVSASDAT